MNTYIFRGTRFLYSLLHPVSYALGKDRLTASSVSGAARSCYAVCSQLHNITEYCQRGGTTCSCELVSLRGEMLNIVSSWTRWQRYTIQIHQNILYGKSSAKLPVTWSLNHYVFLSFCFNNATQLMDGRTDNIRTYRSASQTTI